jgi:hypothetical protein
MNNITSYKYLCIFKSCLNAYRVVALGTCLKGITVLPVLVEMYVGVKCEKKDVSTMQMQNAKTHSGA